MSDELRENKLQEYAKSNFETALNKGFWRSVFSWFANKDNELIPFDDVLAKLPHRGQHYRGVQTILLEDIVGSVGRYQDFDRAFLPIQSHSRSRWINIDVAYMKQKSLPPISVYQVGSSYFVKDGNHRVSVARKRKQKFIDAEVVELDIGNEGDPHQTIEEMIKNHERMNFNRRTRIRSLIPEADITFSVAGGYDKVLEHIEVHRWYKGEEEKRELTWAEAVEAWYLEVYVPLLELIREQKVLKKFPGRTESDLYLWVIEHLYFLRERDRKKVTLEEAVSNYKEYYSPSFTTKILEFLNRST